MKEKFDLFYSFCLKYIFQRKISRLQHEIRNFESRIYIKDGIKWLSGQVVNEFYGWRRREELKLQPLKSIIIIYIAAVNKLKIAKNIDDLT